jgi:hypothetical protein
MVTNRMRGDELEPATSALLAVAVIPPCNGYFLLFKMPCKFFGQTTEALLYEEIALKETVWGCRKLIQ